MMPARAKPRPLALPYPHSTVAEQRASHHDWSLRSYAEHSTKKQGLFQGRLAQLIIDAVVMRCDGNGLILTYYS